MQYYFKLVFVLHSSKVIFSFLIKKSRQKATEIEIASFHSLGNPKGHTLDHSFYASHIRHNFPYKTDTYIDELAEIFLKLSMKTVQVHLKFENRYICGIITLCRHSCRFLHSGG